MTNQTGAERDASAYQELLAYLEKDKVVEGVVFLSWTHHRIKPSVPVPPERMGQVLTLEQAEPYMREWSFDEYGYDMRVWTNTHVYYVHEREDANSIELHCVPRHPVPELHD